MATALRDLRSLSGAGYERAGQHGEGGMMLYLDQRYAINNDRLRIGNEVGIARMARDGGDTWAMSPETAEKLGWALIAASRDFGTVSTYIDTTPAPPSAGQGPAQVG